MKQVTFFKLIFFIAFSMSVFSASIIAGEGAEDDFSDTHPWDLDGYVNDSTNFDDNTISSDFKNGNNDFLWSTFSLSSSFSIWLYNSELFTINKVTLEKDKKTVLKYRGKLSRSN